MMLGTGIGVEFLREADVAEAEQVMRTVLEEDLGGYQPQWHTDLDDLAAAYLVDPRRTLVLARVDGRIVGTAGVRPCQLSSPPNPDWLVRRYSDPTVCQLVRVWIASSARRRGVGRALVREAVEWARKSGGYSTVYLHTDASAPGAEAFWRSLPTVEVYDARPDPFNCVHFQLDADKLPTVAPTW